MAGVAATFKKWWMADGQEQAGFWRSVRIVTFEAVAGSRADAVMFFPERLFICFMAFGAEFSDRFVQELGFRGEMGLVAASTLAAGGRSMAPALFPVTVYLVTAQADFGFFLEQETRVVGAVGVMAGVAVEFGYGFVSDRPAAAAGSVIPVTVEADLFSVAGQQEGFRRGMGLVTEFATPLDKGLMAVCLFPFFLDLLVAAAAELLPVADQKGFPLASVRQVTTAAVAGGKRLVQA